MAEKICELMKKGGSGGSSYKGFAFGSASKSSGSSYTGVPFSISTIDGSSVSSSVLTVPAGKYKIDCGLAYATASNYGVGQLYIDGQLYAQNNNCGTYPNYVITSYDVVLNSEGTIEFKYSKTGSGSAVVYALMHVI